MRGTPIWVGGLHFRKAAAAEALLGSYRNMAPLRHALCACSLHGLGLHVMRLESGTSTSMALHPNKSREADSPTYNEARYVDAYMWSSGARYLSRRILVHESFQGQQDLSHMLTFEASQAD